MARKICFISSCGGHFMQLIKLLPVAEGMDFYVVTEKNVMAETFLGNENIKHYFLSQQERKDFRFFFKTINNAFLSLYHLLRENPDYVITTGAGVAFFTCILSKMLRKKLIYIESFARIYSPSKTGNLVYRFADYFYVQWEEMLSVYPKAIYDGSVH